MAIADLREGAPKVEVHDGRVAVYARDDSPDDPADALIGLALPPHLATVTALRILAAVRDLDPKSVAAVQLRSIEGARVDDVAGKPYARLEIELEQVVLPVFLDRAVLAQLVDDLAALLADLR